MSVLSTLRGLTYLAADARDAVRHWLTCEPQGDCGLGAPQPEPPLTADELVAVRQLIEERFTHAPVASASPPTPADATGPDHPAAAHDRHMRRLLGEDKGRP